MFPNGDVYDGEFSDDGISGRGKLTCSSGMVYEGEFKDDLVCRMAYENDKDIFTNTRSVPRHWQADSAEQDVATGLRRQLQTRSQARQRCAEVPARRSLRGRVARGHGTCCD